MKEGVVALVGGVLDLKNVKIVVALVVCASLGLTCLFQSPVVAFGAGMVIIFILGVLISPLFGVVCLLFLEYVRIIHLVPALAVTKPNLIVAIMVLVSWMLHVVIVKKTKIFLPRQVYALAAFVCLMVFSIFGAYLQVEAVNLLKGFLEYAVFCFLIIQVINTPRRLKIFLAGFLFSNTIVAFLALPKLYFHYHWIHHTGLGLGTFLGDGNDLALAMNIVIPIAFLLFLREKSRIVQIILVGILVTLLVVVVLSGSRGGTVTLVVTGLLLLVTSPRKMLTFTLVGILLAGVFLLAPRRYFDRILTIGDYEEDPSAQGRMDAWSAGFRMALDHPLTGVGPANFAVNYAWFYTPPGVRLGAGLAAHSVYFETLGELGFPGLLCLLILVCFNFADNRRVRRVLQRGHVGRSEVTYSFSHGLDISLTAFLVGGAFLSATYYPHLFVLTGMFAALRNIARGEVTTEKKPG